MSCNKFETNFDERYDITCKALNVDATAIKHLKYAYDLGLGEIDTAKMNILSESV